MAEKETKNKPKDLIEAVPEELDKLEVKTETKEENKKGYRDMTKKEREDETRRNTLAAWVPKTELGKLVKAGKLKNFDEILDKHKKVLESEISESLLPLESDLLLIGQSKGKFGGGKRRAWRQTQKKTMEGNVVTFSCMAVVGDGKGHVGIGMGEAQETLPSREKAFKKAKLNVVRITRGWESEEEDKSDPHTVPFIVNGKCGSVRIRFFPAPRGTGLVVGNECKKILRLAGIKDVYSKTFGQTRTTFNVARACMDALQKTNEDIK